MGVFDVASPLFSWLDGLISGWLPDTARLVLWAVVAGVASMALYGLMSNQAKLAAIKAEMAVLRQEIAAFDGPFSQMWGLVGRNLRLALRQLWVTFVPAVIASLPVVFLLVWVSTQFDATMPAPGEPVEVEAFASDGVAPPDLHWRGEGVRAEGPATWAVSWPEPGRQLELLAGDDEVVLTLPPSAPVGLVHQRRWWNALLGNPAGYLPPGPVDAVEIDLPRREYVPFGPSWLRGWIPLFFAVVIAVSLLLKILWRIH
jgi:hypothetical protein